MLFHVNPSSGVPIYLQIETQVKNAVAAGALKRDQPMPSVRKLAAELGINPNTVARAYQELIREGLLESRAGRGVFVAERRQVFSEAEQARRLRHLSEQLCQEAALLGTRWTAENLDQRCEIDAGARREWFFRFRAPDFQARPELLAGWQAGGLDHDDVIDQPGQLDLLLW